VRFVFEDYHLLLEWHMYHWTHHETICLRVSSDFQWCVLDRNEALSCVNIAPGSEPDSRTVRGSLLEMLSRPAESPVE